MLTVRASAKKSEIDGIGLFSDQKIKKGTITWRFNPRFDILFDPEEVKTFKEEQKVLVDKYAFYSKKSGKYVYSIDDSRFTNHSQYKNNIDLVDTGEGEKCGVANRDIEIGEELLVNYLMLDAHDAVSDESYLSR